MRKTAMAGVPLLIVFAVASCSNDDTTSSRESTLPQVSIQTPWDGNTREGIVDVLVEASDNAGIQKVELFANNVKVGTMLSSPYEMAWDLSSYSDGTTISVYARATDINGNTKSTPALTVTKGPSKPPVATMTSPSAGWTVMQGYLTSLSGTATDPEDGVLSGDKIIWSSSLQGKLGNGNTLNYRGFVIGNHVITMSAEDSDGNVTKQTVNITVNDNDKDYVYIQEGLYTIGAPLFTPSTVSITRPFLISKTEVTMKEFKDTIDLKHKKLNKDTEVTTARYKYLDNSYYNSKLLSDTATYGDYPACFYTMNEFIVYCESKSVKEGLNESYMYLDNTNAYTEKTTKFLKPVFVTRQDQNYNLNGWRLPTEAEWMIAAYGGNSNNAYPWGNEPAAGRCNSLSDPSPANMFILNINRGIVPVKSYPQFRNAYGLYNMAGNVGEICSDIYLSTLPVGIDYVGYSDSDQVEYLVKGGAWYSRGEECQISARTMWIPFVGKGDPKTNKNCFDSGIGARIVRSLNPGEAPW